MAALTDHLIHTENGKLADDTPRAAVDVIAHKAVRHPGRGGIVVHFHGGLVSHTAGVAIAGRLLTPYLRDADAYPVFFAWESGLLELLGNNLGEIAGELIFRRIWHRVAEIAKRKFAQSGGDRAANVLPPVDSTPISGAIASSLASENLAALEATESAPPDGLTELSDAERMVLENELMLDPVLATQVQAISNGLRDPGEVEAEMKTRTAGVRASSATMMDPRILDRLVDRPQPGARGSLSALEVVKAVVKIAAGTISRFVRKRHHGFHATVVEEILRALYLANVGEQLWSLMKKDTADAFGADGQIFGGTAFLEALQTAAGGGSLPKITLVGHSTGAVFISEFIEHAARHLPGARFDVVFLAPASTFRKTARTLADFGHLVDDFRMFTMDDAHELKDRLVPVLYPHSLLYFVSGVVEPEADMPLVGMQRFYDRAAFDDAEFPDVKTVRDFVLAQPERAVWSIVNDGLGRHSESERHVDFDDDPPTLDSVAHAVTQGF